MEVNIRGEYLIYTVNTHSGHPHLSELGNSFVVRNVRSIEDRALEAMVHLTHIGWTNSNLIKCVIEPLVKEGLLKED